MDVPADRYRVVDGSQSGHCCFTATVVDTAVPTMDGDGKPYAPRGVQEYEAICECFERSAADTICDAMNGAIRQRER